MKKVVLITGASSGIGKSSAALFAQSNAFTVYVTARKPATLGELVQIGCIPLTLDVTDEASMYNAIATIHTQSGGVDILINNAGYAQNGALEELPLESIRKQFETNIFGLLRMCQLVLPSMRAKKSGRIINIGSVGGEMTSPGASAYHATKYALESLTDGLRGEVQAFGIKVSLIKPGGVHTNFMNVADNLYPEAIAGNPYSTFREKFLAFTVTLFDPKNKSYGVLTAEQVAAVVYEAATVAKPKTRYRVGAVAKIMPVLRRWMSDNMWDNMMLKQIGVK